MERLFDLEDSPRTGVVADPAELPLAARMRPATLGEFVGQEHLLERGSALRTAIEEGRPHSMILYGPPGTGKTTLARMLAVNARAAFEEESAVKAGRAEVREVLARAEHRRATSSERTIFFLDEIHRFNKAQQDTLLPAVENGLVVLVGATTENPFFEVNSALLSRCRIYELHALEDTHVLELLRRALAHERGIPNPPGVKDDALEFLAARAGGDARMALSALELAAETVGPDGTVTLAVAEDALQRRAVLYDKQGDKHYDLISAWIKSTRGSDPDASLLYLAGMLEGGEDPRFIARRMVILASEDIGNADPRALRWRWRPPTPSSTSGCPRRRSTWPRRPSTWRSRRSRMPPTRRSAAPASGCASTACRSRRPRSRAPPTRARRSWAAASATTTCTRTPRGWRIRS